MAVALCGTAHAHPRHLLHGPPPHHRAQRPDQRARATHPGVAAGDRALVSARVDGAHAAVLHIGRCAQRRLQAGAGRHQPVPGRLQQPDGRNAAAGGAGRDGGDREDLPRSQEPAARPREAHAQHLLPGQRAAAGADLSHGRAQRAARLPRRHHHHAHRSEPARWQLAHAGAAVAHTRPARPEELRPLHHPAQQRPFSRHPEGAAKPARAVPAAAAARRLGHAPQDPSLSSL